MEMQSGDGENLYGGSDVKYEIMEIPSGEEEL